MHDKELPQNVGQKKSHFERLDVKSRNLQFRKLYEGQLFSPNLEIFLGKTSQNGPPK